MRKHILFILVCVLVVNCVVVTCGNCQAATHPELEKPQYTLTKRIEASLDIASNGEATCRGYIRASSANSTIDITVKLMKKNGTSWKLFSSWSVSNVKSAAELVKSCTVQPGTYKVTVTGTVKSITGQEETVSTFVSAQ